jgi:hypothetical protein
MAENHFAGRKWVTPVGRAGFVALSQPFQKDGQKPKYECLLRLEEPEAVEKMIKILDEIEGADKSARKKKPQSLYRYEEDEETGEPTGVLLVAFRRVAGGTIQRGPRAGQEWSVDLKIRQPREGVIGSGSLLQLQFECFPTAYQKKHFVQLQPKAVKVIDLVTYEGGGGDNGDDGFFDDADELIEVKTRPVEKSQPAAPPVAAADADEDDEDF